MQQPTRSEAIEAYARQLREMEDDLDAAREHNGWSAVASLHNAVRQVRKQLIDLLPPDEDEEQMDMTPAEIAQALAGGILELPDDVLPVIESALRERRRNGLRLVSG